ncbi:hypothetical protein B7463_g6781, partial [Scytalidium lignicola]
MRQAFLMFGYDAGVLSGVQDTKPYLDAIGNPQRHSTTIIPMIASSYTLGTWAMSMVITFIALPMGRRNCILLGNVLVIIGGAIQASSFSVAQIIVGRLLCGFGVGFITSTVPTYIAEMSIKSTERGPAVAFQLAVTLTGVALSSWLDFGFTRMTNQVSWRFPIAFQTFLASLSLVGMLLLPDTPRWYYVQDRMEEGDRILSALHDLPIDDEHVQYQKREILEVIALEKSQKPFNLVTLIWDNTELQAGRRLRTSFLILALQQLMGVNMLVYYSTVIFSQVGLSPLLSSLLAAVMNTIFATGSWLLPGTIERVGRRTIMLWCAIIDTIFMVIFVIMVNLPHKTLATQWTAVACVIVFIFFFGYGWMGISWLYGPEIAPLRYRHLGGAFGTMGFSSFTFVTVFAGGIAITRVGPMIWIWQAISCALAVVFVWYNCPETSGKTLEEIDHIFMKNGGSGEANLDLGWDQEPVKEESAEQVEKLDDEA